MQKKESSLIIIPKKSAQNIQHSSLHLIIPSIPCFLDDKLFFLIKNINKSDFSSVHRRNRKLHQHHQHMALSGTCRYIRIYPHCTRSKLIQFWLLSVGTCMRSSLYLLPKHTFNTQHMSWELRQCSISEKMQIKQEKRQKVVLKQMVHTVHIHLQLMKS